MGIRFTCPSCGRALNVKSELAGKRGRCPYCQGKIAIPTEDAAPATPVTADVSAEASIRDAELPASSDTAAGVHPEDMPTVVARAPAGLVARVIQPKGRGAADAAKPSSNDKQAAPDERPEASGDAPSEAPLVASEPAAPAMAEATDPIGEAPQLQWYVMPPGVANQYGPAAGDEFRNWIAEGRVTAETLVWRQDWPEWKRADSVFSQLHGPPALIAPGGSAPAAVPVATPAVGVPVVGVGSPPVGQFAPMGPSPPGTMAAGGYPAIAPSGGFPVADDRTGSSRRTARPYRPRSNTGPMVVIIALLVAMIPLSYFVYKVVSEQLAPGAAAKPAATAEDSPVVEVEDDAATSSDETEE